VLERQKIGPEARPKSAMATSTGTIAHGMPRRLSLCHRMGLVQDTRPLKMGFPVRGESATLRSAGASWQKGVSRSGEVFFRKCTYPCNVNQKAQWGA